MKNGRILVTGGAGFIGSHLVQTLLNLNWKVTVLDNCTIGNKLDSKTMERINFIDGDVRDLETVYKAAHNCEAIIHLAAIVGVDEVIKRKLDTIDTETIGTVNIVNAAKKYNVKKLIYSSSSAVYKNVVGKVSQETDPLDLVSAYAVAKRLNEQYLEALTLETGISTNCVRFFNVYGGSQDQRMVVPRFINQAVRNQPLKIFGKGQQTRDFTHVNDVVKSISVLLYKTSINGNFNISTGHETTILELAKLVKKVTKSDAKIELLDFPDDRIPFKVMRRVGSTQKLFQSIRMKPEILLQEGLQMCLENMQLKLRGTA